MSKKHRHRPARHTKVQKGLKAHAPRAQLRHQPGCCSTRIGAEPRTSHEDRGTDNTEERYKQDWKNHHQNFTPCLKTATRQHNKTTPSQLSSLCSARWSTSARRTTGTDPHQVSFRLEVQPCYNKIHRTDWGKSVYRSCCNHYEARNWNKQTRVTVPRPEHNNNNKQTRRTTTTPQKQKLKGKEPASPGGAPACYSNKPPWNNSSSTSESCNIVTFKVQYQREIHLLFSRLTIGRDDSSFTFGVHAGFCFKTFTHSTPVKESSQENVISP